MEDSTCHWLVYVELIKMRTLSSPVAALAALPLVAAGPSHFERQSCDMLTAKEVRSMGNSSLFTRWRPYYHFNAPVRHPLAQKTYGHALILLYFHRQDG